jgi:hypothetical protein
MFKRPSGAVFSIPHFALEVAHTSAPPPHAAPKEKLRTLRYGALVHKSDFRGPESS